MSIESDKIIKYVFIDNEYRFGSKNLSKNSKKNSKTHFKGLKHRFPRNEPIKIIRKKFPTEIKLGEMNTIFLKDGSFYEKVDYRHSFGDMVVIHIKGRGRKLHKYPRFLKDSIAKTISIKI